MTCELDTLELAMLHAAARRALPEGAEVDESALNEAFVRAVDSYCGGVAATHGRRVTR